MTVAATTSSVIFRVLAYSQLILGRGKGGDIKHRNQFRQTRKKTIKLKIH
jgi:hypothetical protein